MRRSAIGLLMATAAVLSGCGTQPAVSDGSDSSRPAGAQRSSDIGDRAKPPSVQVRYGDRTLELNAWTSCWSSPGGSSVCSDGAPPKNPPSLGDVSGPIAIQFPNDGWSFQATQRHATEDCRLSIPAEVASSGTNAWTMTPGGPAGAYEVDLFGRGPEGDISVSFAMEATSDGPIAAPTAALSVFYEHDGKPVIYGGASLSVSLLPQTPTNAAATVTVTAADGRTSPIALHVEDGGCTPIGTINLVEDATSTSVERDAVEMYGSAPYDLTVDLVLDGTTYTSNVRWPDDVGMEGTETTGVMPLDFTPALPGATADDYRGAL